MKTSIHQINYLPWIGYFNKIKQSDLFVLFDIADYTKNSVQNRNKIRTATDWVYLTIPMENKYFDQPAYKVNLPNNNIWQKKHWKTIELNYKKAPYFDSYKDFFEKLYSSNLETLHEINEKIIRYIIKELNINTEIKKTSELKINKDLKKTDLLLNILQTVNATVYLSGQGGKSYLEKEKFKNIKLELQEFEHPLYKQVYPGFVKNLSIIDLLFNTGEKAQKLI